jgi:hypothetical protein
MKKVIDLKEFSELLSKALKATYKDVLNAKDMYSMSKRQKKHIIVN